LFLITETSIDDSDIARALDHTHTHRAQVTLASAYENLLCAALDREGGPIGIGTIKSIDFAAGIGHLAITAAAPAPIHSIQLGHLSIDPSGRELGEASIGEI
jgi:polynucleotide 5'-kinase involved in rRNA processing